MKTAELMDLLARGAGPVGADPALPRLAVAPPLGVLLAAGLALGVLGPLPASVWAQPAPWLKLLIALAALAAGFSFCMALARPLTAVKRLRLPRGVLLLTLLGVGLIAAWGLVLTPGDRLASGLFGHSWWICPLAVLCCALPTFAAAFWRLRGLAPTRLRAAGAAAGLLAGGCGAFGYALACEELSPLFIASWYPLGIALVAGLGALLGPKLLRW
jgi:hypothetical protein